MGTVSLIHGIGTAGCGSSGALIPCNEYVTKYRIQHNLDGITWMTVVEGVGEKVCTVLHSDKFKQEINFNSKKVIHV